MGLSHELKSDPLFMVMRRRLLCFVQKLFGTLHNTFNIRTAFTRSLQFSRMCSILAIASPFSSKIFAFFAYSSSYLRLSARYNFSSAAIRFT